VSPPSNFEPVTWAFREKNDHKCSLQNIINAQIHKCDLYGSKQFEACRTLAQASLVEPWLWRLSGPPARRSSAKTNICQEITLARRLSHHLLLFALTDKHSPIRGPAYRGTEGLCFLSIRSAFMSYLS
jgi:hypothetical protein